MSWSGARTGTPRLLRRSHRARIPRARQTGAYRVLRGGTFFVEAFDLRASRAIGGVAVVPGPPHDRLSRRARTVTRAHSARDSATVSGMERRGIGVSQLDSRNPVVSLASVLRGLRRLSSRARNWPGARTSASTSAGAADTRAARESGRAAADHESAQDLRDPAWCGELEPRYLQRSDRQSVSQPS